LPSAYYRDLLQQVLRLINTLIAEMGRSSREGRVLIARTTELRTWGSFNTMIAEVQRLTAERERQERERARLELEALRLQINPHFLTNTLNSIKMLALQREYPPDDRSPMRVVSSSFRGGGSSQPSASDLSSTFSSCAYYGDAFDVRIDVG
jgi:hypothetical protein